MDSGGGGSACPQPSSSSLLADHRASVAIGFGLALPLGLALLATLILLTHERRLRRAAAHAEGDVALVMKGLHADETVDHHQQHPAPDSTATPEAPCTAIVGELPEDCFERPRPHISSSSRSSTSRE